MRAFSREERFIGACMIAAVVLIVITAVLAPSAVERDQRPTTYNTGPRGAKVAFLALQRLGYETERWEHPATELNLMDAEKTLLIVTDPQPNIMVNDLKGMREFVRSGGMILGTGPSAAYSLLPEGPRPELDQEPCTPAPEGFTALAQVQHLKLHQTFTWKTTPTNVEFAQACADRAGVLYFHIGKGTVVLWSESTPLSNEGLQNDANLSLVLVSLGTGRTRILFDEYIHSYQDFLWRNAEGTPIRALQLQLLLLAVLVVFSFVRRHGPLRELARVPRTSPLEFAHSMGNLYHRAGAGEAAIEEACRRFYNLLQDRCGISRRIIEEGPESICQALYERLGFRDDSLSVLLVTDPASCRVHPADALRKIKSLHRITTELNRILTRDDLKRENKHRA